MAQLALPGAAIALAAAVVVSATSTAARQAKASYPGTPDDHPAIQYAVTSPTDPVQRLAEEVSSGKRTLRNEGPTGYLQSVLNALNISMASQVRVMSKTGIQKDFTSPANPRQFFFNESTYVGYIPGAPLLELASHDAQQGMQFYVINQGSPAPVVTRATMCISCHLSANTLGVPGVIDRSNHIDDRGVPIPQLGFEIVNHTTPHGDRWGGWSSTDSEIAELMTFNHQSHAINLMILLNWDWRMRASDGETSLGPELTARINEFADYLTFVDEAPIPSPVKARPGFTQQLAARFPRDSKGRSLADADLTTHLLRYPCSYMVYAEPFEALPPIVKVAVYNRVSDILLGRIAQPKYAALSASGRQAALEILKETKKDFPDVRSR